jgi:transposase
MRFIGLDVHRDFCEVAIADAGEVRAAGRVQTEPAALALFAQSLGADDEVALEATGNALGIARLIEPHVRRVVLANPKAVKGITRAGAKTDKSAWAAAPPRSDEMLGLTRRARSPCR